MVIAENIHIVPERKTTLPSVLVAVMGPYPMEYDGISTNERLREMCRETSGHEVNPVIIPDMVFPENKVGPGEDFESLDLGLGIGMMRNWAIYQAQTLGYDSLFLVENDAVVQPDTLSRLLKCPADIVIPHQYFMNWPPIYNVCWLPHVPLGTTGYMDIEWCVFTALLINSSAFNKLEPFFIGATGEGQEYARWAEEGLGVQMDLDTTIEVARLPRGHVGYDKIPFNGHMKIIDGEHVACSGKMVEVFRNKIADVWACSDEDTCGHIFTFNNRLKKFCEVAQGDS